MIQGYELLKINHAGALILINGKTINYGVIRIDDNKLIYYTGKGLRELWNPNMTDTEEKRAKELIQINESAGGEEKLIASGHIAVTPLDQIDRVIF